MKKYVTPLNCFILVCIIAIIAVFLAGCSDPTPAIENGDEFIINGCVVDAIAKADAVRVQARLKGTTAKVRVLLIQLDKPVRAHAAAVFEWEGHTWFYDRDYGSREIHEPVTGSAVIAALNAYPYVKDAIWLDEKPKFHK